MNQTVLMYHDVFFQTPSESGLASDMYKISVELFERQIIKVCELEKSNHGSIILTFDDGGSSFYSPISNILDKYSLKGYFFIATKYIGTSGFLTKEQIVDIDKRGHYIGSHSYSHPENITSLPDNEMNEEWARSVMDLEEIVGHKVIIASIPNGYQSNKVLEAIRKANIKEVYTSKPTCKQRQYKGISLKGRFVVLDGMTDDDIVNLINSKRKRQLLLLKWRILNVVKLILGNKYEVVKQKIFG